MPHPPRHESAPAQRPGRVPDRLRLPLSFDAERLSAELARLRATPWTPHFVSENFDGDWSAIPLRAPAGETHPIRMIYPDPGAIAFADAPALAAAPYLGEVLSAFACPLRVARLMRLAPGSRIKRHTDPGLDFEHGEARLHIPITTCREVDFRVNETPVEMAPGETWYLRLSDPHSVENRGAVDRVHLVIDAEVNDWLRDLFWRSQAGRTRPPS